MSRLIQCVLLALALVFTAGIPSDLSAQYVSGTVKGKRLILKDGSFQATREWKREGDRVRYYSTERFLWEELPSELVDWPATERYNAESAALPPEVAELSEEEKAERAAEDARSPEVAPGVRLPAEGGVYLLDTFEGKVYLVEMVQNGGEIRKDTGRNILRAALNPFAVSKQRIVLSGTKARIQAHNLDPMIFVNITPEPEATGQDARTADKQEEHRFRAVRLKPGKKNTRHVGDLRIAITGKVSERHEWIDTRLEPVSGGWVKVVPVEPLQPGEYALVEMLGHNQINLYVWDFGVDPAAPQNPAAWVPVAPEPTPTGTDKTLLLEGVKRRD